MDRELRREDWTRSIVSSAPSDFVAIYSVYNSGAGELTGA